MILVKCLSKRLKLNQSHLKNQERRRREEEEEEGGEPNVVLPFPHIPTEMIYNKVQLDDVPQIPLNIYLYISLHTYKYYDRITLLSLNSTK